MVANFDMTSGKTLSPSKLAHVVLRTGDKNRLVKFYNDLLGSFTVHEEETLAFITYDDEHHRIAIVQLPNLKSKDATTCGLEHIAFSFDSLEDLFFSYRQRKAKGIVPFWCINHGLTISLYYKDPDGNIIETQYDIFEKNGEADRYMRSPAFQDNPIGVDFDPEEFIKRIESGESLESLVARPDIGKRGVDTVPGMRDQLLALGVEAGS